MNIDLCISAEHQAGPFVAVISKFLLQTSVKTDYSQETGQFKLQKVANAHFPVPPVNTMGKPHVNFVIFQI